MKPPHVTKIIMSLQFSSVRLHFSLDTRPKNQVCVSAEAAEAPQAATTDAHCWETPKLDIQTTNEQQLNEMCSHFKQIVESCMKLGMIFYDIPSKYENWIEIEGFINCPCMQGCLSMNSL